MTLSVVEKLTLGRELGSLMGQYAGAAPLARVRIGKDIIRVMSQLGLNGAVPAQPEAPAEAAEAEAEADMPQVVTDFLAGAFVSDSQKSFIDHLRAVSEFVGQFLTLSQAAEQTERWIEHNQFVQA